MSEVSKEPEDGDDTLAEAVTEESAKEAIASEATVTEPEAMPEKDAISSSEVETGASDSAGGGEVGATPTVGATEAASTGSKGGPRGAQRGGFRGGRPPFGKQEGGEEDEFTEKVVFINRCAKVVKGGRRFSFSALVVSGDHNGRVGFGFGKANEVAECIRKASDSSKKNLVSVAITENTIPHEVTGEFGGGKVLLRPASPGTGIIAGGGVRAVVEAAGIKDVLCKSLGSNNHANVVKATLEALTSLRTKDEVFKLRGKKVAEKAAL